MTNDNLRDTSNSEARTFKRCRRKWWFSYHLALTPRRPEVTGVRAIGTRLHAVVAAHYDPAQATNGYDDCVTMHDVLVEQDMMKIVAYHQEQETDPTLDMRELLKDADLSRAMIEGYFEWLEETGEDSDLEVIGAEESVRVPFNDTVALVAKLDLRVKRMSSGSRLFMDHKTVDNFTVLSKVAHLDEQFLHYSLLDYLLHKAEVGADEAKATFVEGGVFNMIRKVKRTKTAKPPFFKRMPVHHNLDELRSFYFRLAGVLADLVAVEYALVNGADHRMVAYANPTRDCHWDCDFFNVCGMADDARSDLQGVLEAAFVAHDPYARYHQDPTDDDGKDKA